MHDFDTVHYFMPDQRSLCDLAVASDELKGDARRKASICGSCMLVLHHIRVTLAVDARSHTSLYPPSAQDARDALRGTRWDAKLAETIERNDEISLPWLAMHALPGAKLDRLARELGYDTPHAKDAEADEEVDS